MTYNQVRRDDSGINIIDKEVKNKFKWHWLEEKDSNGMFLSGWVRKIDVAGKAICLICNCPLRYGGEGKSAFVRHARGDDHRNRIAAVANNSTLPSHMGVQDEADGGCNLPYGAAPNVHNDAHCNARTELALPKIPSFQDRVAHNEAFILSFMTENSLPFTMAPKLIEFAKFLAKDAKVLSKLSMCRITAAYKLTEGLAPVISGKIMESMRSSFFSMNVDECFSNNHKKIFSILVSYFAEEKNEVVVQHYRSKEFDVVNAQNLSTFVLNSFEKDGIPYDNVVSNLSDSTNYMRGKKAGFEALLRIKIPHLQDIDGDVCHHAHNGAGKLLQPFGKVVEKLCTDMHTEMQYSTDLRAYLVELCEMLSIHYHTPPSYTEHRWLSILPSADVNLELLPALTVLYHSWVEKGMKSVYRDDVDVHVKECSERAQNRISIIQKNCAKKKLTEAGLERKKRIVEKLFYHRQVTELHLSFYTHVLPLIKAFVLVFEQKEPMVHRLFDELKSCMQTFLCCFLKVEHVTSLAAKKLKSLDVSNAKLRKQFSDWNLGRETFKLLKKVSEEDRIVFEKAVTVAFTQAAAYLQKKLPLENKFLKYLSSLDPKCHGVDVACNAMKRLGSYFPNVIKEEEMDAYDADVDKIHLLNKKDLPSILKTDGKTPQRLDHWWDDVLKRHDLQYLGKVVKAALSIFTGPRIEQSFSLMNNTLTSTTNRLHTSTFSALQTVKMDLLASKEKSTQRYHRRNFLKSPINPWLCRGMLNAHSEFKKRRDATRKRVADRHNDLGIEPVTKKKKETIYQRAERVKEGSFCEQKKRKIGKKKVERKKKEE